MRDFTARIRAAFRDTAIDLDVLEELAQHAESTYETLRADGVSEADALARIDRLIDGWRTDPAALQRSIKGSTLVVPPAFSSRSFASGALADVVFGARLLRLKPGYAAVTILTIALGVGAATTLFSVAYGVLLRPLPWAHADGLIRVSETRGGREGRVPGTILNSTYLAWAESPATIDSIGAFRENPMTLTGLGDATRVTVSAVTPSMLKMLKVNPDRGRIFTDEEGERGKGRAVIISRGFWEQRFGARDDVIGQALTLDGTPYTIVGVLPRDFRFPSAEVQAWVPWYVQPLDGPGGVKSGTIMRVLARLKPGVTPAQAAAEGTARAIAAPDAGMISMSLFGAREPILVQARDAKEAAASDVRPAIIALLVAAVLLFVTATANVANMQLARATSRHRELTIRAALGAGTARIARQLLVENAIVGVLGSIAGLGVTAALHAALPSLLPAGFPRVDAITIDARVLGFTLLLSLLTTIVCGVLPLMHVRRLELARSLADSSAGSAGAGRGRVSLVRALIIASQVAVTCVLVIGGALLARSFAAQLAADRGYDSGNVLTAAIPFPVGYAADGRATAALQRIVERLKERPGVTHVGMSSGLPLVSSGGFSGFNFPSPIRGGAPVEVQTIRRVVSPEYFGALGIRVRAGRPLTTADGENGNRAVVVNRSFVASFLDNVPIERAVGLSLGTDAVRITKGRVEAIIVGVVDDLKQDRPGDPPQPEMFVSYAQVPGTNHGSQAFIVMRIVDDPAAHVDSLRTAIREEDPALAIDTVMTMDQRIGTSVARPRLYALLFAGFAVFALVIAGAGLFGVLSQTVSQRSRELAVRTALGASRTAVIAVALKQMSMAMAAGLIVGLWASASLSSHLSPFIYGISTRDWLSFGVAPIVLLIAGAIACIVPARRVARTDPVMVLRDI
jgi:putative ABC transport system permease protein